MGEGLQSSVLLFRLLRSQVHSASQTGCMPSLRELALQTYPSLSGRSGWGCRLPREAQGWFLRLPTSPKRSPVFFLPPQPRRQWGTQESGTRIGVQERGSPPKAKAVPGSGAPGDTARDPAHSLSRPEWFATPGCWSNSLFIPPQSWLVLPEARLCPCHRAVSRLGIGLSPLGAVRPRVWRLLLAERPDAGLGVSDPASCECSSRRLQKLTRLAGSVPSGPPGECSGLQRPAWGLGGAPLWAG